VFGTSHSASGHDEIRLGTDVYNIGLRHPFVTARAATTVDILSGGRLALGIGASWLREEWEAVGLDFDRRGARVDEAIDVCRRLWTEEVVEHHGTFFDFGPVAFEPKPVQRPGPALHIGGDGRRASRCTVGTGWLPTNYTVESSVRTARLAEPPGAAGGRHPSKSRCTGRSAALRRRALCQRGVTRPIVRPWSRSRGGRRPGCFADQVLRPIERAHELHEPVPRSQAAFCRRRRT
jgi:alkanesulfonate monooxygenase SsuD/methylene tetrahydromethanopterin reductase-like flavin-dependent oxidoreductase (luciferase family)